jgi:hypothetical protein
MPNILGLHALPPAATGVPSKRLSGYARRIGAMCRPGERQQPQVAVKLCRKFTGCSCRAANRDQPAA